MSTPLCVYCYKEPAGNSEHVFPKALGGPNVRMPNVGGACNNEFSKLERVILRNSPVALMRTAESVAGYGDVALGFDEIFVVDEENHIAYECGIYGNLKPLLRPQFISIGGKIHIMTATIDQAKGFYEVINSWWKNCRVIALYPPPEKEKWKCYEFNKTEKLELELREFEGKPPKGFMLCKNLVHESELRETFEPRLFLNDDKQLIVRGKTHEESIEFMKLFVRSFLLKQEPVSSFPSKALHKIVSHMGFDPNLMIRGYVKIALNALMYSYPKTSSDPLLEKAKKFVLGEIEEYGFSLDKNLPDLDSTKSSHFILFQQRPEGVMARLCLFGGHFKPAIPFSGLIISEADTILSVLVVNFASKTLQVMSFDEFVARRIAFQI